MSQQLILKDVLLLAADLPWNHALYLPKKGSWSLETRGLVWDPDDCGPDEEVPAPARQLGFDYVLSVADIQDILLNLKQQKSNADLQDMYRAFAYYCEHDTFIDVTKTNK